MAEGYVLYAAADVYASPQALANLFPHLRNDARVIAFGAKLSHRSSGKVLNPLLRLLWKLSFSSTPAVNYEPWAPLKDRIDELHLMEYFYGCMSPGYVGSLRHDFESQRKSPRRYTS